MYFKKLTKNLSFKYKYILLVVLVLKYQYKILHFELKQT